MCLLKGLGLNSSAVGGHVSRGLERQRSIPCDPVPRTGPVNGYSSGLRLSAKCARFAASFEAPRPPSAERAQVIIDMTRPLIFMQGMVPVYFVCLCTSMLRG